jgi:hypothetical protein
MLLSMSSPESSEHCGSFDPEQFLTMCAAYEHVWAEIAVTFSFHPPTIIDRARTKLAETVMRVATHGVTTAEDLAARVLVDIHSAPVFLKSKRMGSRDRH